MNPGEAVPLEYVEVKAEDDYVDVNEVLEVKIEELHDVANCPMCNSDSPRSNIAETPNCNHTSPGEVSRSSSKTIGNHTSPETQDEASQESLGTRIERFITAQRKFSDDLQQDSPVSTTSLDNAEEIKTGICGWN